MDKPGASNTVPPVWSPSTTLRESSWSALQEAYPASLFRKEEEEGNKQCHYNIIEYDCGHSTPHPVLPYITHVSTCPNAINGNINLTCANMGDSISTSDRECNPCYKANHLDKLHDIEARLAKFHQNLALARTTRELMERAKKPSIEPVMQPSLLTMRDGTGTKASKILKGIYEKDARLLLSQGPQMQWKKNVTPPATQTSKPAMMSQGTQTIPEVNPGTMDRGTQTISQSQACTVSRSTQTIYPHPSRAMASQSTQTTDQAPRRTMLSQGTQTIPQAHLSTKTRGSAWVKVNKPAMTSQSTQTLQIANVQMNPAVKGEKEEDWQDVDAEVPAEDKDEDDDWTIVDV